ncbi:MFS transporter [Microbacterium sp. NC79]|uniref:MFS transporter n=1 Tax=Microbacterium sp. NC79 TaxID=2851009 RepID=UPI001C2CA0AC|nr:MFS transporter [Microbacterium sp. NC79]MBV0894282.1 MFS transporter [Microbacterium sp. NC79]
MHATPTTTPPTRWLRSVIMFMSGQTVSLFGSMLVQYAVFWYLTLEFKSGWIMTLAAVFGFLPQAIVSVFGGVWADRHNRKYLIIVADASIAVTTLALAILLMTGEAPLWAIFLTLAIRSAGAGVQTPAVSAMIPQITPAPHLIRVNGILQSINSAMALLVPAAAGALFAITAQAAGSSTAALVPIFFIDVVTAAIGIGLLAFVRVSRVERSGDAETGYLTDLVDGVKYVATHSFLRWLLVLFAIVFILTVAPSNLTPLMLVRTFGTGNESLDIANLTILEIAFSVGMMLGGILIATVFAKVNRIGAIVVSSFVFGALSIGLGFSPNTIVFFAFMFLVGLAVPFFSTASMTLIQETVEPERQGRVFGFVSIVMAVAMPFGMVILGPLADIVAIETLLVAAGLLTFVIVGIAILSPAGRRATAAAKIMTANSGTTTAASDDSAPGAGGEGLFDAAPIQNAAASGSAGAASASMADSINEMRDPKE